MHSSCKGFSSLYGVLKQFKIGINWYTDYVLQLLLRQKQSNTLHDLRTNQDVTFNTYMAFISLSSQTVCMQIRLNGDALVSGFFYIAMGKWDK